MNHYLHTNRIIKFAFALFLSVILYNASGYSQNTQQQQALQLVNSNMQELGLTKDDVENLYVADAHTDKISGVLIAHLQQQYKAINIHNALYSVAFKNGKLVSSTGRFVQKKLSKLPEDVPVVSPVQAIRASAQHLKINTGGTLEPLRTQIPGKKLEFKRANISRKDIPVNLVWVPVGDASLRLAWEVRIDPLTTADMWNVRIDALSGEVLNKDNWMQECRWDETTTAVDDVNTAKQNPGISPLVKNKNTAFKSYKGLNSIPLTQNSKYLVIPYPKESPLYTDRKQSFHENPWLLAGANNQAVTYGWHFDGTNDYAYTRGNNVLAQEDRDNNNTSPGYSTPSVTSFPNLNFPYLADLSTVPQTNTNTLAAITNTFYWCNIMHDISYQYGFDEAAGNFQKDNMGRGGLGNDPVQAEAQDGSGTNNANFATPPDGENPRMQMYLWNPITSFQVNAPGTIARTYTFTQINAGPNSLLAVTGSRTGNVALYGDNDSTNLACLPATDSGRLNGKIALIDRGSTTCTYTTKIKNAQNAGAIAVIIINNGVALTGTIDSSITIPSILISAADGALIKNQVISASVVNVTISYTQIRDGDLDNGIIAHEYTHGISNRLTGGPKTGNCLSAIESGGMGEGWSDYFGLMVTTDWGAVMQVTDGAKRRPIGNFALGQPTTGNGIRAYPYTTDMTINPLTYANVAITPVVHAIGTVWCSTLWDMTWGMIIRDNNINTNLYNASADGGNSAALKLVTLGMKLQPCNPGFMDARNAILKADSILFQGRYSCVIWNAFARRGMGVYARQGFADLATDQVIDYSVPDSAIIKTSVDRRVAANGEVLTYNLAVKCQCAPLNGLTIRDTLPANVTHYQGGLLNPGREIAFSPINLQPQEVASYNVSVKVNDTYSAPVNLENDPVTTATLNPILWTRSVLSGPSQWTISNAKARGLYAYHAPDSTVPSNFALTSTKTYLISRLATLSFWHFYDTEPGYDGGVVELSTDSGATWIDAGPYMTDNGYTSVIQRASGTDLSGRMAFNGFSGAPSFRQTIIDLSSFAGRSVKFRFRFISDAGTGGLGWFIDDILLRTEAGIINRARLYQGDTLLSTSSDRTLIFNQPALPLVSGFDVATENDQALVSWQAANDYDFRMYEVERSTDGINFEVIGSLPTSVSGNTKNSYQFIDMHPVDGTNFYRLKQVDFAGTIVYSDIKSLEFGSLNLQMAIRPNPSTGWINITLPASQSTIPLRIYDIKGNLIRKNILKSGNQTINLSGFSKGVYILHFNLKDQVITRKLIIQ